MTTNPRALVLRAPGTNCDGETEYAIRLAGGRADTMHVNEFLERRAAALRDCQLLCVPGGFSYGDDIAAGRIFARQLETHLGDDLLAFRDKGNLILGICNGFQVLLQSRLLEDVASPSQRRMTLTWNTSARYEARWVWLQVMTSRSVFLTDLDRLFLPVAHAEGRFVCTDSTTLDELRASDRIAICYASDKEDTGSAGEVPFPENPNGSMGNVAGIQDATGRVLGLMPHPERFVDRLQHPQWTRLSPDLHPAGLRIFQNAIAYLARA